MAGRVVVVTGGSRGLGREICRGFAADGEQIVVASRKYEACQRVAGELATAFGVRAEPIACHVGRWADCDALIDRTLAEFGRIDVLVNNAGMSPLYPSLAEVSEELFDKVIDVNLKGAFRLAVRAGAAMTGAGGGAIVNVTSIAAVNPGPHDLPYAAAKAGLNAVTVGLSRALAPSVRVNAVMAGPFDTDVTRAWTDETRKQLGGNAIPLRRIGRPDEIVGAIRYLTGAQASYTTGAVLTVDGGMTGLPL